MRIKRLLPYTAARHHPHRSLVADDGRRGLKLSHLVSQYCWLDTAWSSAVQLYQSQSRPANRWPTTSQRTVSSSVVQEAGCYNYILDLPQSSQFSVSPDRLISMHGITVHCLARHIVKVTVLCTRQIREVRTYVISCHVYIPTHALSGFIVKVLSACQKPVWSENRYVTSPSSKVTRCRIMFLRPDVYLSLIHI